MLSGNPVPDSGRPVDPARRPPWRHELLLFGAHGGAGVTTLRSLLEPAWDMGAVGPIHLSTGVLRLEAGGRPVVLVSRNTVANAGRCIHAVRAITGGGGTVALLIVVADGAGPEPKEATARFRLLEGRLLRGLVRMPFISSLRLVDDPADVDLPKAAVRAMTQIRARIDGPALKEA